MLDFRHGTVAFPTVSALRPLMPARPGPARRHPFGRADCTNLQSGQPPTEEQLPVHRSLANKQLDSSAVFQFGIGRAL